MMMLRRFNGSEFHNFGDLLFSIKKHKIIFMDFEQNNEDQMIISGQSIPLTKKNQGEKTSF